MSGRGGAVLKTVVNAHIKEFVFEYDNRERQTFIDRMNLDRWDVEDFAESDSVTLTRIFEASIRDVGAWTDAFQLWSVINTSMNGERQTNGEVINGTTRQKNKLRSAIIEEQKYILPESVMTVLVGIQGFEKMITEISSMTQEIITSLLEYLKLFNSRSLQLILGTRATRSAGLKNIIIKHLALASQTLSFTTALISHIRDFVRRRSQGSGNLMIEFDKVKRLYQEHQGDINDKLIDIMNGRADTHINVMKKIDWDASDGFETINVYMETFVKETSTLQKVLSKHLSEMTVRMIMDSVSDNYRERWEKAFENVKIKTSTGKQRYFALCEAWFPNPLC